MCGIFCSISRHSHVGPSREILESLQARGPDCTGRVERAYTLPDATDQRPSYLTFTSTVLSLRGETTVTQPYQDQNGVATLCWNGEAWSIAGENAFANDTQAVHELLLKVTSPSTVSPYATNDHGSIAASRLASIAGPYAFVFYDSVGGRLYFGRDFLGRRSLLWKAGQDGELLLSSVTSGSLLGGWTEVEADGVYCLDFNHRSEQLQDERLGDYAVHKTPYRFVGDAETNDIHPAIPLLSLNKQISIQHAPLTEASPAVYRLECLLRDSLALRVLGIPDPPPLPQQQPAASRPARLAILFSGGLDCTMLARITHDLLPLSEPIDLLNVAFENPRIHKTSDAASEHRGLAYESCPDRITGRASYTELGELCPSRELRFVAINIPYTETIAHRDRVITLMHPHNTEMDLSIAYALYFASRGSGLSTSSAMDQMNPQPFTTSARVLLSGLGADELFAGYTRHTTAFNRRGYEGLIDELDLDISRLGKRNLGRDDRIISNWGREARFPFLDENLVTWALAAPVSEKCGFGETTNESVEDLSALLEPGKKVLRCLAWKMGMRKVAAEKKRAIQFGARTAKMTTGKSKGTTLLS